MFNAGKENDEESVEILEEIPNELADLWHELSLLENRLAKQRMSTQTVKLELCGDEGIVINDKSEKEAIKKSEFLSKYSEEFVSEDLCKYDTNQCAGIWKSEESAEQKLS
jgi:hypothetical protein